MKNSYKSNNSKTKQILWLENRCKTWIEICPTKIQKWSNAANQNHNELSPDTLLRWNKTEISMYLWKYREIGISYRKQCGSPSGN
jgi:hypothetical protein